MNLGKLKQLFISGADTNGNERDIIIAKSALTGLIARAVNIGSGLLTVPVMLSYLDIDLFGIWMALTAFVAFLGFTDLGLGIGLQNSLSRCDGLNDRETPKTLVSSALLVTTLIFLTLTATAIWIYPLLPMGLLVKTEIAESSAQILPTAQAITIVFGFGIPASLAQRVLVGYQKSYLSNCLLIIGRLLAFASIFVCIWLNLTLPYIAALFMGLPFVVMLLASIYIYATYPWLRPSFAKIRFKETKDVMHSGLWIMAAQIAGTLMLTVPIFIVSSTIGSAAVATYAVTQRLLGISGILVSSGMKPLWPAYGEAYAAGDKEWIFKTYRRSLKIALSIAVPTFIFMTLAGRPIIEFWTGDSQTVPSWSLLLACNVLAFINALNAICFVFLNGTNHLKGQAIYGMILAVLANALAFYYAASLGTAGIIWTVVIVGGLARSFFLFAERKMVINRIGSNTPTVQG
jgi:O-antigen/teichoic acid export membrane protein